ncbi:MAG: hypothetical protein J0L69_16240 [Bacteroidetes bacterium]|nr:hypothetical protein [Bacteroidota bacterium]
MGKLILKQKAMKTTILTALLVISFAINAQETRKQAVKISDDQLHYLAGNGISAGVGYTMNFLTKKPVLSSLAGFVTGAAIGIGKEIIYDKAMNRGTYSTADMATTAWGSLVGALSLRVVIHIENKHHQSHFLFKKNKANNDQIIKDLYAVH